jgi:hypothetical protein
MSSPNGDDVTTNNGTSTIANTNVNYTATDLQNRMERNRLDALGKRTAAQRETANALQNLTDQTQTQIQKLQERALYDEIRCHAVADNSENLKFTKSSVYVNTFNPPTLNADPLPTQRAPECPLFSKLLFAAREGILTPEMVNLIMDNTHDMAKSPDQFTSNTTTMLKKYTSVDSDTDDGSPPLLRVVQNGNLRGSHLSSLHPSTYSHTCPDNLSPVSVATDNLHYVDLTDLPDDNANKPPNKKYKATSIEVNLRVKLPGNKHPIVKTFEFNINSNSSGVADNK